MRRYKPFNIRKDKHQSMYVNELAVLQNIFKNKQWTVNMDIESSTFNRFRKTLSLLDAEEKSLILDLTKRFIYYPQNTYTQHIINPLEKLKAHVKKRKIYFIRCLATENDSKNNKSCEQVFYLFKGATIRNCIDLGDYKQIIDLNDDIINEINDNKAVVVLVDDFIGTGDTAIDAIKLLFRNHPTLRQQSNVFVLSIIAMEQGITRLKNNGNEVFCDLICRKGITDFYKGDELIQKIQVMQRIESKLENLQNKFRFGYKQSEGLVCMERCPNNTFPIYWLKKKYAPYER